MIQGNFYKLKSGGWVFFNHGENMGIERLWHLPFIPLVLKKRLAPEQKKKE